MCAILTASILLVAASCSRDSGSRYSDAITGTWEWTGDACDVSGACTKDIYTDEASRMQFTPDGLFITFRGRMKYRIEKKRITLSLEKNIFAEELGEIVSIKGGVMLIRTDGVIRRYGKVK